MRSSVYPVVLFHWLAATVHGDLVTHDSTFYPDHVLRVTAQNISVACESRYSVVVNGTSPGPEIRLKSGGSSWIRVYNDMEDFNLTMHWHGIAQRMAQFSDGSFVSQWPIPPMHFFDYEVEALAEDAGTYFYHSHIGVQALTAAGPLIVEDCGKQPYDYDEERVLLLGDYFAQTDEQLEAGLVGVPFNFGGETRAVLVNGKGIGINHTATATADGSCELPVVDVEPDRTYRFRFIGSTSLSLVVMSFEGHEDLEVISVDGGQYTQPASTDRMQLGSGQRFDVLFKTKSADQLAAEGRSSYFFQFETRDRPAVYRGYGVLRYNTSSPVPAAPSTPVFNLTNTTYDFLENTLTPLNTDTDFPSLAQVTRRVILDAMQFINPTTQQWQWRLANLTWDEQVATPVPLLVDIYLRGQAAVPDYDAAQANYGWDPATRAFPARVGEVLEIVWQNTGSLANNGGGVDVHPFHAHGEHYYDVGSGNGTYDPEAAEAAITGRGYAPVRRDTTMLYRYTTTAGAGVDAGWRAWRIRIQDPGVWMLHCHTLQHMIMGMQTVWVVGEAADIQKTPTDLSQGYFTYGGDVYGNDTHDPQCYQQFNHTGYCGGSYDLDGRDGVQKHDTRSHLMPCDIETYKQT